MSKANRREALTLIGAAAGLAASGSAQAASGAGAVRVDALWVDYRRAALGLVNPRARFSWTLVAADPRRRDLGQSAFQVVLTAAASGATVFDSGRITGADMAFTPPAPIALKSQTPYVWRVRVWDQEGALCPWSQPRPLITGVMEDWRGGWIAAEPDGRITAPPVGDDDRSAPAYKAPLLRRAFRLDKPIRHAVLSLSGLGAYGLSVNGAAASDDLLNPGWTDYDKTALYNTFDVTRLLRQGDNVLGVRLGGGMYDIQARAGRYAKFTGSHGAPKLILQLKIVHADGDETWIVSDGDWRAHDGPITFSSIYGGEDFDARLEPAGWDRPGPTTPGWAPIVRTGGPGGQLKPQATPGVKPFERFKPIAVTQPSPGVFVYDLGQNFAGRPVLTVRGQAGATVRITPAELLTAGGRADQTSMTGGGDDVIRFDYTLGESPAVQTWAPRFSYTGFRYLQVEGARPAGSPGAGVEIIDLQGESLHADLETAGTFSCGEPMLNQIHGLIRRAVLSNSMTILTDCPHREKLGWLEQTYLNAATVFYNLEALPLYDKLTGDMIDSQRPSGMVPSIAPELVHFVDDKGRDTDFRDSPEWGAAIVLSPWAAFRFTGDLDILRRGYPAMRRYADYLASRAKDGLLDFGLGDWYDHGPAPPGQPQLTSRVFTATATWFAVLTTLAQIADRLGQTQDAAAARGKAETVKASINGRFFDAAANRYDRGSQTAQAMALALNLAPPGAEAGVLAGLIEAIRVQNNHVSAGDIGYDYLVRALVQAGRTDLLHAMLTRADGAGYGAQLARGATALTEAWDANPSDSQDHFMLGEAERWLFGVLGGVDIDFARGTDQAVLIAPRPLAEVGSADVTYRSVLGEIRCRWRIEGERLGVQVETPPGMRARVRLPGQDVVEIGSGLHDFTTPWAV